MTNGYRRNSYYYGPQARGSYDPYSKYPNWAGGLRELLNNIKMMKMWRESQEYRRTGKETRESKKETPRNNERIKGY